MKPNLMLLSYPYGWVLHKEIELDEDNNIVFNAKEQRRAGITCDPASIAHALMGKTRFTTGLIPDDIIYHEVVGVRQTVVGYRQCQRTGIWLEGKEDALRVPLPHLLLVRTTRDGRNPDYKLFACAKRPESLTDTLYHAPLPNCVQQWWYLLGQCLTSQNRFHQPQSRLGSTSRVALWQPCL